MKSILEIAASFDAADSGWALVTVESERDAAAVCNQLVRTLKEVADDEAATVESREFCDATEVAHWASNNGDGVMVASFSLGFAAREWEGLDLSREELRASRVRLLFVLTTEQAAHLAISAPNIMSVIGASADRVNLEEPTLGEDARRERIHLLESEFTMSSEAMVERWKRGDLAPDPRLAEWLILLGRGELITEPTG